MQVPADLIAKTGREPSNKMVYVTDPYRALFSRTAEAAILGKAARLKA